MVHELTAINRFYADVSRRKCAYAEKFVGKTEGPIWN